MEVEPLDPLFVDIETTFSVDPQVCERLAARVKPPGNYTKPETIAKWEREDRPGLVADAVSKTALDGSYGRIVAIGWAVGDEPTRVDIGDNEVDILQSLFSLKVRAGILPIVVGHNVADFDLEFIKRRAVILGIKIPAWFPVNVKPWSSRVFDTMRAWTGHDRSSRISLSELASVLGIQVNETMDGRLIPQAFQDADLQSILKHCCEDVRVVREIYRKMKASGL